MNKIHKELVNVFLENVVQVVEEHGLAGGLRDGVLGEKAIKTLLEQLQIHDRGDTIRANVQKSIEAMEGKVGHA